jgi:hypothetical protein
MEAKQIFDPIFGISIKNYPFEKIYNLSSSINMGLKRRKFANFALNIKKLRTTD